MARRKAGIFCEEDFKDLRNFRNTFFVLWVVFFNFPIQGFVDIDQGEQADRAVEIRSALIQILD